MRTSRGRMATSRAYRHFGLQRPGGDDDLFPAE
jgi:Holliday junction resolvasome RuvABC ATP-dependent DNA helicase subunit